MSTSTTASPLIPYDLRCEYKTNPMGIDVVRPRLSWKLKSDQPGQFQSAYQVQVASSAERLEAGKADLWDSGKVESDETIHIEYAGNPLASAQEVFWKVRVWDRDGRESRRSDTARWEMGLLDRSHWSARWVGSTLVGAKFAGIPVPFLRKEFRLKDRPVRARLYVTALGLYEVRLNGQRVGIDELAPGWTDYRYRVQYRTYDVTAQLSAGDNAIGAILGDGWYCGHICWFGRQAYGDRPRLLGQIVAEFADGSKQVIATDSTWKVNFGPIVASDLLMGETYDARLEMPGWDSAGFDEARWQAVEVFDNGPELVAAPGPAVRSIQEIRPVAEPKQMKGWPQVPYLFDFGQNLVGRLRIRVKGKRGATLTLRHAEVLDERGNLYTANLRSAKQTDYYTLKGEGEEVWEPRFTFHGFRYAEITGWDEPPTADSVTAVVLHSDTPPTGSFECSDPLVNQLQKNIDWGQRGNFVDVPTDCPQRDERLGWTGDAQVFIRTAAFNRDVAGFFTKWLTDLTDSQASTGSFPNFAPLWEGGRDRDADGGPAWADAGIICPWTIYLCYGDTRLLEKHYGAMVRFIEYMDRTSPDGVRCAEGSGKHCFGDWLNINANTPHDLLGTAFFAYSCQLMSRIAKVLGRNDDAARFARLFEREKSVFQAKFVKDDEVTVKTQTANILALHFDLLTEPQRQKAIANLVADIESRDNRLSAGFVGSPYINHVLTAGGRNDVAYRLLHQTNWPSWLYPVTQGATTIWERWDGWTHDKGFQDPGMNSFNHYAYGAIGAWLYQTVAGIDVDPDEPGYKHIVMRPTPGGKLTHARATLESVRGPISSEWRIENGRFVWTVDLPPNTRATATLPAGASAVQVDGTSSSTSFQIPPGRHVIEATLS